MNIENSIYLQAITRQGEVWAQIADYPDYLVSNLGRVFGLKKNQLEKGELSHNGYRRVPLYKNGKKDNKRVSNLVAAAFCGGLPNGKKVHHINRHRTDDRAINLIVVTPMQHRAIHDLYIILGLDYVATLTAEQLYRMCNLVVSCFIKGGEAA